MVSILAAVLLAVAPGAAGGPADADRAQPCTRAPAIDLLRVHGVEDDAVTIAFLATSDGPGTFALLFDPGERDVARNFQGPRVDAVVRIPGFSPSRRYTATLVLRNACGQTRSSVSFTTLAPGGCTAVPRITTLRASASTARSALVEFALQSSGRKTFYALTVEPSLGRSAASSFDGPRTSGRVPLSELRPATLYRVTLTARNGCGAVSAVDTFRTPASATSPPPLPAGACRWEGFELFALVNVTCAEAGNVLRDYFLLPEIPGGWNCRAFDPAITTGACVRSGAGFTFRRL